MCSIWSLASQKTRAQIMLPFLYNRYHLISHGIKKEKNVSKKKKKESQAKLRILKLFKRSVN